MYLGTAVGFRGDKTVNFGTIRRRRVYLRYSSSEFKLVKAKKCNLKLTEKLNFYKLELLLIARQDRLT